MCGLVFAGSNTMGMRDVEFFEQLLYCDIVRGDHSTGVFAGYHNYLSEPFEVRIRKAAVPADIFIRRPDMWDEVKHDKKPNANGVKNSYTIKYPKFLVGHNRYATMGEIVDANAHPFQHGAVTLVHNGTLDNQSLLPDHQRFKVDSENIAHAINEEGIEETIKKLNGKFMLIWHDARDNTLNFLRNKDRPFHFVETTTGDWFGASEEDMIMWLMGRPKGPTAKRHFEAEVGVQYVFDVSNGQFKFKEERKHELPTFRYVYTGYTGRNTAWYNDYDDDYDDRYYRGRSSVTTTGAVRSEGNGNQTQSRSQTSEETQKDRLNNILRENGVNLQVGEWVFFEAYQFDKYPNNSGKGKMTGFMAGDEYIEVQAPGVNEEMFGEGTEYKGKIISAFVQNYILTVIVGPTEYRFKPAMGGDTVSISDLVHRMVDGNSLPEEEVLPSNVTRIPQLLTPPPDDDDEEVIPQQEEEDEDPSCAITANGEFVTKKEWEVNGALNCCANCGSPISWDDVETTEVRQGNSWCQDCAAEVDENGYPKDSGSERPSYDFKCTHCKDVMHEDLMSSEDNVCITCYKQYIKPVLDKNKLNNIRPVPVQSQVREVLKLRRKLQNGMVVTKPQWEKMNSCSWCNDKIPWEKAENAVFVGQRVTCEICDAKLEMGQMPYPVKR